MENLHLARVKSRFKACENFCCEDPCKYFSVFFTFIIFLPRYFQAVLGLRFRLVKTRILYYQAVLGLRFRLVCRELCLIFPIIFCSTRFIVSEQEWPA